MPTPDPKNVAQHLNPVARGCLTAFLVVWTLFAGFFFVFGLALGGIVGVLLVQAIATEPMTGPAWVFVALFPPFIVVYEWLAWRSFRFGWAALRVMTRRAPGTDLN